MTADVCLQPSADLRVSGSQVSGQLRFLGELFVIAETDGRSPV